MFEGIKKAIKKIKQEKSKPKILGSGLARRAAQALDKHNIETEKAAKELDKYKKGGKVKRDGPAFVHKGEQVLTKKQAKNPAIKKAVKKAKKEKK